MLQILRPEACCGCTACAEKCPKQCIMMQPDAEGFLYPVIDQSLCIDCGNCVSACFSHALTIGAPDWKLHFNPEKCIACKLCLKACPLKLFRIEFAEA
jgi:formate hydrogenlyase subunit 6/NADH:ubiquinone oxidoreductase subunit I